MFPLSSPDDYAEALFDAVMDAAGDGRHTLTISVMARGKQAAAQVAVLNSGPFTTINVMDHSAAVALLTVAVKGGLNGGIVLRTHTDETTTRLRGWQLTGRLARPLPEGELFAAYCTDPRTGEPVAPEPGVEYADAPALDIKS